MAAACLNVMCIADALIFYTPIVVIRLRWLLALIRCSNMLIVTVARFFFSNSRMHELSQHGLNASRWVSQVTWGLLRLCLPHSANRSVSPKPCCLRGPTLPRPNPISARPVNVAALLSYTSAWHADRRFEVKSSRCIPRHFEREQVACELHIDT